MKEDMQIKLAQQIARLQGTVESGFSGVHKRQDVTNGRVEKCEIRIAKVEEKITLDSGEKRGTDVTWRKIIMIVSISSSFIGAAIALIVFILQHK